MINWYDIEVEQKIAQERYQEIIQSRKGAQSRGSNIDFESLTGTVERRRDWLGDQLIALGCQLKIHCQTP